MRYFALLLLVCWSAFGAAGDYIGAQIDPQGWQLWLEFSAMGTNGTFTSFGFGTNNSLTGNEKVRLTLTSQGFDSAGVVTTYTRTLYGTKQVRFAYPSDAFPDVSSNAVSTTIKVALSDFVYSGDSNLAVTVTSGLYTNLTVNSATVTAMPVTNNSVRLYPKPVANWTWPGYQRETNATMRLRAVGFCQTAGNGQPLACMKFIASQGATSITNTVSAMAIDRTLPDIYPTGEYFSDINMAGFTPFAVGGADGLIRCNFEAYPRLGTETTIMRTVDAAVLTANACTLTNLYDLNYAYCDRIGVVDPAGSDSNGRVTNVAPISVNSAHYFLSIRGAALQLAATNNAAFGHNDTGGGIIYVRSGITNWTGGNAITTLPVSWVIVQPYPGDTVDELTTQLTGYQIGEIEKLVQMKIGGTGNLFFNHSYLWLDRCMINSTATALFRSGLISATHCTFTKCTDGFKDATSALQPALLRGNLFGDQFGSIIPVYAMIGNRMTSNSLTTCSIGFDMASSAAPAPEGLICYNNVMNFHFTADKVVGQSYSNITDRGCAVVQNVFEASTNATGILFAIGAANLDITNVIIWNNVFTGQRNNIFYNWDTAAGSRRWQCQQLNNLIDSYNIKTDNTATGGLQDGTHTNNWEQVWGVDWDGNVYIAATNTAAVAVSFINTAAGGFAGLNSIENSTIQVPANYPQYVDRRSVDPAVGYNNTGDGNYRTKSTAPQLNLKTRWVLPYDLEGNARSELDPPGAYSSAIPRKGAGFFGL